MKKPSQGMSGLKPSSMIDCMLCEQPKPSTGSKPFRSLMVCAECALKLAKIKEPPRMSKSL
jgi:hypothetical protein